MTPFELLSAGAVLLVVLVVGIVVHELLHASVLRAAGVPVVFEWLHGGRGGRLGAGLFGTWASVRMLRVPQELPAWQLRLASMAPLALALPLVAVGVGAVPDPFAGDSVYLQAAVVAWLACALPSPADFSLFWHAEEVIAEESVPEPRRGDSTSA